MIALVASATLLALPSGALASSHHGKRHSRAHRTHIRRFGDMSTTAPSTTTDSPAPVGNVVSFDPTTNILVVHFNDGNTVTGVVTSDTEIDCASSGSGGGDQSDQGGTSSGLGDQSDQGGTSSGLGDQSDQSGTTGSGQTAGGDDQGDDQGDDDQGDDSGSSSSCGTSSLQTNAPVLGAEVRFSSPGTTWESIQLG